ncbi:MAG: DUF106 domain-containing protein [Nitrososphaerota archaeon]|nr:DUF106 domain-containing protein [Nitrososphaerota archaeon]
MFFMAVGFGLMSNLLTRRFVNLESERRIKAEINAFTKAMKDAVKSGDKAEQEKLKKKEPSINQMRMKMSTARSKVALYTIVPFFAIYYLVIYLVGPCPVALSPLPITIGNYLMTYALPTANGVAMACPGLPTSLSGAAYVTPFGWYLISSFAFSGLLTKLLKTQT